jgi:hypothetical protein
MTRQLDGAPARRTRVLFGASHPLRWDPYWCKIEETEYKRNGIRIWPNSGYAGRRRGIRFSGVNLRVFGVGNLPSPNPTANPVGTGERIDRSIGGPGLSLGPHFASKCDGAMASLSEGGP